ncbi:MAG: Fpg/Nei family DNA glycosylase [Pirellulaceae bacterium]
MPELPEVETMRRGVLPAVGATIDDVQQLPCPCRPLLVSPGIAALRRRVRGREVQAVDRLGKRVVLRLSNNESLVFEPRMTGLLLVADPPSIDHLRLRLDLSGCTLPHIWYWDRRGLGSVRLLKAAELAESLGDRTLGPDALTLSAAQLAGRLASSRREIKVALLDQRAVAGIGNLYASEILHVARVHPCRRCHELTPNQWKRIHLAMYQVLEEAILHEGSTLSDGTYSNALNKAGGYQNHHRVYDRAGELCPTCGHERITRLVQAQRSTFFCAGCQDLTGS